MNISHDEYIRRMNEGPLYDEKYYNPDEWLRLFRRYSAPGYLAAHLRAFAYWMKVNGRWVLK